MGLYVSDEEKRYIDDLLSILRSGHQQQITATTLGLDATAYNVKMLAQIEAREKQKSQG